ncbi:MAG: SGNH/GDSL hydrolase family protein [Myxococcota bacterium]|nr:SGNH/GDSL hydrolase family protein [Myxococcota bacterium]
MKRLVGIGLGVLAALGSLAFGALLGFGTGVRTDPAFFESAIQAFEEEDRANPPVPGVTVFVGSSSFVFWADLAEDMAPAPVLNRGFGGAHMAHVLHNVHRVVTPYAPRLVVVYAGDNDLRAGSGKTAEGVAAEYAELVEAIHSRQPDARVEFITIKPSVSRWEQWPEMERANELIAAQARADERLGVIDIASPMRGPDGRPREGLFMFDGLHLNRAGYELWAKEVRPKVFEGIPKGSAE